MKTELDDLDHQVIDELRRDGRLANTEIARQLGVSETTIRNRIQRLISEGFIQVDARINLSRLGYSQSIVTGVICESGRISEVARALSAMEEVRYVSFVTGRYDLVVGAIFRSRGELLEFLTERMGKIPGVARTETLQELKVTKRDYDYWEVPLYQ